MSTQQRIDGLFSKKSGSLAIRTALAACAGLAISVPSIMAATPAQLESEIAATLNAEIAANDANFPTDAANAVDSLMAANPSLTDEEDILFTAIGTISDALKAGSLSSTLLLGADTAIGTKIADDTAINGSTFFLAVLEDGMKGISGRKGKSATSAPLAAQNFAAGLLAPGTIPAHLAAYETFAVDILRKVHGNAVVDGYVAYEVGLHDQSGLVTLATGLYASYPADRVTITQGVVGAEPAENGSEGNRGALVASLVSAQPKLGVFIIEGATYTDPYYAGTFTNDAFGALVTAGRLKADAASIAKDEGQILGQDADALTDVAATFETYLANDDLVPSKGASYATALLNGAIHTKVLVTAFSLIGDMGGGGKLAVGTAILGPTATDLESIVDEIAEGIYHGDTTLSVSTAKIASEIGVLAEDVAKLVKNEPNPNAPGTPLAVYIAASLAHELSELGLSASDLATYVDAVSTDVGKATDAAIRAEIKNDLVTSPDYASFAVEGPVTPPETAVTNY